MDGLVGLAGRKLCGRVVDRGKPREPTMSNPLLSLQHVSVTYEPGATPTLTDVSLEVLEGERIALLGLNGSGKTTLLLAVVGLVPFKGDIAICGTQVTRSSLRETRDRIGFLFNVPEDQLLFPKVIDDVSFGLLRRGLRGEEARARSKAMLAALGVGHLAETSLHHLSHGQKQRVALAGALVCEPPLLLFDEPTAALDPPGKQSLAALLARQSATMLVATHDLDFAARLCTRFVAIEDGRIVLDGRDVDGVARRWKDA
jgi:cobalt/nickel transport system ATP-binding protein